MREGIKLIHSRLVEEYSLDNKQKNFVSEKLNYLSDAIDRQSRTDWINTTIGVFVTIAMTIGVSAVNADKFWLLIKESLHSAFQLLLARM